VGAGAYQTGVYDQVWTPMSWLPFMYLGYRGSIRNKFIFTSSLGNVFPDTGGASPAIIAVRTAHVQSVSGTASTTTDVQTGLAIQMVGENGWVENDLGLGKAVEVNLPYYGSARYELCRITSNYGGSGSLTTDGMNLTLRLFNQTDASDTQSNSIAMRYISAGDDFSLGRFRFVPRVSGF
jgi:hypothetical protein